MEPGHAVIGSLWGHVDGPRLKRLLEPILFFLISVGYTIGWTALSSLFANLKRRFGPAVLLQLNLAYFLPSLPLLYLQTQFDAFFSQKLGTARAYAIQLTLGLGGAGALCALHPYFTLSFKYLLAMTSLLGICCGIAFGSSYQLVSHFSQSCQTALTTGFVGSGPIVLFLELIARMGPHLEQYQRIILYSVVSAFSFLGLGAALLILSWHDQRLEYQEVRQDDIRDIAAEEGIELSSPRPLESHRSSQLGGVLNLRTNSPSWRASNPPFQIDPRAEIQNSQRLSRFLLDEDVCGDCEIMRSTAVEVWPAALALACNTACATLVFPFFPYIPSSGLLPRLLPQAIFFARTVADIVGRLIPHHWVGLTSSGSMHLMTIVKLGLTPVVFCYIGNQGVRSDIAAILYIFLFWLQGGAANNAAFILASKTVRPERKSKSGSLMAFVFQSACLLGLAVAFLIQRATEPFKSQWT